MSANASDASNSYVLLRLAYVDGMAEKRGPYREAHLAGASNDPAFAEFIAKTVNGERTAAKYAAIKAEAKATDKE